LRASDPRTVKLASGKPQLIEFFAFWSGPSQAMAPIVHPLEQSYSDRMNFLFLDIDDPANKAFKTKLGFRFEPHFFLLDSQGNIMKQWVGYVRTQEFVDAFEEALKK
jgi:thiol-disulfide isomerase/thioredoxin